MTWQPYELHTTRELQSFLTNTLAPRWATLRTQFAGQAFYVVWWPDSCVRVRVFDSSPDGQSALTDLGPEATCVPGQYERELARYGGSVGLDLAERFFCSSSELALALLRQEPQPSGPSLGRAVAAAAVLSASLAHAVRQPVEQWRAQWFKDLVVPRRWDGAVRKLASGPPPKALPPQAELKESLGEIGRTLDVLGAKFGMGFCQEVTHGAGLSTSLLHGFMNRLAVPPLDELYIAWLLLRGQVPALDDAETILSC